MPMTNDGSSRLLRLGQGNHSNCILPIPGYDDAVRRRASVLVAIVLLANLTTGSSPRNRGQSPLYTHFIESVAGAPTIRAFGWQSQYQKRNYKFIDQSQRPAYLQYCIQSWLGFVLDMLVTVIAAVLVAIVVTWKDKFSAGNVGVSLVMVMSFSSVLMRMIKAWTMMESSIGAVARVKRFVADTESEEKSSWKAEVAQDWPTQGNVEFKGLVAAHSPSAEPVIKGISFSIRPSEHVALCGRSGCGKTVSIKPFYSFIKKMES